MYARVPFSTARGRWSGQGVGLEERAGGNGNGSRGGGWVGKTRSDGGRLALHQILVDVVGVALEPGGVEQDVLAALQHRALHRRRRVTLEETLRGERRQTLGWHRRADRRVTGGAPNLDFCGHFVDGEAVNCQLEG